MVARFLGPGFNQFQNYNSNAEEDEDSNTSDEGDSQKPAEDEESEETSWSPWKNGEDSRYKFNRPARPGRIIHLGDRSDLFTDRPLLEAEPAESDDDMRDAVLSDSSLGDSDDEKSPDGSRDLSELSTPAQLVSPPAECKGSKTLTDAPLLAAPAPRQNPQ